MPNPELGSPWVPPNSFVFNSSTSMSWRTICTQSTNNLNFTSSGPFCLGTEFQKLCQREALRKLSWRELCTSADPFNSQKHLSLGLDKRLFLQEKHSCFAPLSPPPSYQSWEHAEETQMQVMKLSSLPAWSHTILKSQKSEERDIFTCFNVIY